MDIEKAKKELYFSCYTASDCKKMDKIINLVESGKLNKTNFWEHIKTLTKRIHSDYSLGRWQCLSEQAERIFFKA